MSYCLFVTALAIPSTSIPRPTSARLPLPHLRSTTILKRPPAHHCHRRQKLVAELSAPFPQVDPFSVPLVVFPALSAPDLRPEILGALLWSFGLYLGFSQKTRWAQVVRNYLASVFKALPFEESTTELLADFFHSFPFLLAGLSADAALRYWAGGNAVWAVSTGTSVALYAGVYELARMSTAQSLVSPEDMKRYDIFLDIADRALEPKGMCHFIDVRAAVRRDPKAGSLRALSDDTLRRFVQNRYPRAKRSPNGFYRGLCIRSEDSPSNSISKSKDIPPRSPSSTPKSVPPS